MVLATAPKLLACIISSQQQSVRPCTPTSRSTANNPPPPTHPRSCARARRTSHRPLHQRSTPPRPRFDPRRLVGSRWDTADPKSLFWGGRAARRDGRLRRAYPRTRFDRRPDQWWLGRRLFTGWTRARCGLAARLAPALAHGITSFLPTVITSSLESYRAVLPQIVPTAGSPEGRRRPRRPSRGSLHLSIQAGCHPPAHIIANKGATTRRSSAGRTRCDAPAASTSRTSAS